MSGNTLSPADASAQEFLLKGSGFGARVEHAAQQPNLPDTLLVGPDGSPVSSAQFDYASKVAGVVAPTNQLPDLTETPTETVNEYADLAAEHAELIKQGKTSIEIAVWLGEKLDISSWKEGRFHGERKVLSTPTGEEMTRLQSFTQALGISWSKANGGSKNHPDFLLLNGYVQNALFGQANMTQVNERLNIFHTDWQKMGKDFVAKAKYLLDKVGLDIKGDWSKLTGMRRDDGVFVGGFVLCTSGALGGWGVHRMWVGQQFSFVLNYEASNSFLCFLA